MSPSPTVSLIMPSYQRGPKIARALDSVMRQTRLPEEVIVVNDGGFAPTAEWVTRSYPQVRLLNTDHGGAALARNRGAAAARGDILILFDDDDEMCPHAVETLLTLLADFPEARSAHCDATFSNQITGEHFPDHHSSMKAFERLRQIPVVRALKRGRLYGRPLYDALLRGNLLQQPWAIYRNTFLELGGFATGLGSCDDWDFYLRISRTYPVAQSDEIIAHHYVEGGKSHLTQAANQEEGMVRVILRELSTLAWREWKARLLLHRRLASLYKAAGDRARGQGLREAWLCYGRSLRTWPFDHVVAARWLLWPLQMPFLSSSR